MGSLYIEGGL